MLTRPAQPNPLDGCLAKLCRAEHHLDTLKREASTFFEDNPYRVVVTPAGADGTLYVAHLDNPPDLPSEDWALLIGDCIHNMRSALDYIAWELAGADLRDTTTMFPIFDEAGEFQKNGRWRIKQLPDAAKRWIENIQPYHSENPELNAFSALSRLDNRDKHKLLSVVAAMAGKFQWNVLVDHGSGGHPERISVDPAPDLVHDAVIATMVFSAPPEMETNLIAEIAFGKTMGPDAGVAVISSLGVVLSEVEKAVRHLGEECF